MSASPSSPPVGYLEECSATHVRGWVHDPARAGHRVPVRAELDGTCLAEGVAAQDREDLRQLQVGDGRHGFDLVLSRTVAPDDRSRVVVRAGGEGAILPVSPHFVTRRPLLSFVAMDIVDNCNLRCPFCVYDYENVRRTNAMEQDVFEAALRLMPVTGAGHFWLSCLHEPTLHPRFADMLERLPPEEAGNVFFTTNLAKRMPSRYYEVLANSGLHHVNVSLESLDPATYERMRKGARFGVFMEQWDALLSAFRAAARPPAVRYNMMAYRSNVEELPALARHLLDARDAHQVEIRATMDVAHIPRDFAASEYLDDAGWRTLRRSLQGMPADRVVLVVPPHLAKELGAPGGPTVLANPDMPKGHARRVARAEAPFHALLKASGTLCVYGRGTDPETGEACSVLVAELDVRETGDLPAFFARITVQGAAARAA